MDHKDGVTIPVSLSVTSQAIQEDNDELVAWARERGTGKLCFIGTVPASRNGRRCNCVCLGCGEAVLAINAGKNKLLKGQKRPHFRHTVGHGHADCIFKGVAALTLNVLCDQTWIALPRVKRSAQVMGLSGSYHHAWVEIPSETTDVKSFTICSSTEADLLFPDGRVLKIQVVGVFDSGARLPGSTDRGQALLQIVVEDLDLIGVSPEELFARLTVLPEQAHWCSHWADQRLYADARTLAQAEAIKALDWIDEPFDSLSAEERSLRRESLLHRLAKEILELRRHIVLPAIHLTETARLPSGQELVRFDDIPQMDLDLTTVVLEQPMGQIRPDVLAYFKPVTSLGPAPLLIEVTVTNAIGPEREQRIRRLGLPAVEIDLSRAGGFVTRTEFADLLVEETALKRWIFHPTAVQKKTVMRGELDARVLEAQRQAPLFDDPEALRQMYRRHSPEEWRQLFLQAAEDFSYAREWHGIKGDLSAQLERSEEERDLAESALASYGYPGVEDLIRNETRLFERIYSIAQQRPIGYRLDTVWQVVNAIFSDHERSRRWHTLYLIALNVYRPPFTPEQNERVLEWRNRLVQSIKAGECEFLRPDRYDKPLGFLFPELASSLRNDFGVLGRYSPTR